MRKLAVLVLVVSLVASMAYADEKTEATAEQDEAADEWVGRTRQEIEAMLGPATKVKRKKGKTVLRYRLAGMMSNPDPAYDISECDRHVGSEPFSVDGSIRRIEFTLDANNRVVAYKFKMTKTAAVSDSERLAIQTAALVEGDLGLTH